MYESFFGLHNKPFELLPNPDFLYHSKSHRRAMTYLDYGIKARAGFILITGEIGSGKTTIIRDLIKKKLDRVILSKVFNTKVSSEQLISMINDDFGLSVEGKDKIVLLRELNEFLIEQFARDMQPVLIIDEAQNLSSELLEEVRMLSNLETDQAKLLQIILVGQPELKKILASPEMRQLRQRININCHIQPLSLEETEQYIQHRLEIAGDRNAATFSPEALSQIHTQSRGVPRLINIICDFLMLSMFSAETREVDPVMAEEVFRELDFEQQFWENGPDSFQPAEKDALSLDVMPDLHRSKVKLTSLLRDITQRIEMLERNLAKADESQILDHKDRLDVLESSFGTIARELAELQAKYNPVSLDLESILVKPASSFTQQDLVELNLEEPQTRKRKSFFRRLFRG
ncbi:putative secretion ATPase, PEP-CTERM locus subfamily [Desulfonatronum thiosulfatophilum]|uniref:Putative secretion ATPase, PEP-CTERM locus subfamily n=1 Tax=Desulfonatronum thiosulfatophilum TaxID=617002 RepID=A0A1G6EKL9_9BACT|nr:XrtA/PEP-CTERM system-associated ATPase [Desulfonatronum thiosulfatophilum]SDB57947.1 putative secretion ATPase, PEP-CTERM locus subfamily [Desulfonatronum thiosulfatophilum]